MQCSYPATSCLVFAFIETQEANGSLQSAVLLHTTSTVPVNAFCHFASRVNVTYA